jgi:GT2 family glycosyltransferase
MELSIIIVNWNSANYLRGCLSSIYQHITNLNFEVIVVDNASYDGCKDIVAGEFPLAKFVQSDQNIGFARANNLGAQFAQGSVLLFLNPDTEIQNKAIERLYTYFLRLPDPGVVGCKLVNSDGSLQTSCVQSLPTILNQILDAEVLRRLFPKAGLWGTAAFFKDGAAVEVEAVSGACMMIRREVFELVGGFSSDYFMYGEDLDLCFKVRRAGFRNYHVGVAEVVHHGGKSSQQTRSNFSTVMMRESVSRFLRKSRGAFYSGCYRSALTAAAVIRLVLLIILFPAWAAQGRSYGWSASFRKWIAILRWGIGLAQWPRQYKQLEHKALNPKSGEMKSCAESAEN